MNALFFVLAIPLTGGVVLALFGHRDRAMELNVAFSTGTFLAACVLTVQVVAYGPLFAWNREFFIDPLNVFLVALTSFVGMTTALFSRPYMRVERDHGKMTPPRLRLYHSMYQLFSFTMLLALMTNNMGILWVAMEAATLTTVLLVSVYRTAASLEAAWKYFILCGVGIAQALFGTVMLYMAAEKVLGAEGGALLWTNLDAVKAQLDPNIITLAFAFLFIGYGTKVGLVPLHNWLPDAHAEGPTPVSAVLSGLLLNVALYAVLRCKVLTDGALGSHLAGRMMMGFGLVSVVAAAFLPDAPARHQAHVRLLVDRAHGPDDLRLRHGRRHRQLRRAAAHDRALADQVGDLLHGGPCGAEGRHPGDGRDPRPGQGQPAGRLGPDDRLAGHSWHAAVRRVRQRVPDHHHRDARAAVGHAVPAGGAGRGLRVGVRPRAADGVRRHHAQAADACAGADRRCSCTWRCAWCSACTSRRTSTAGFARPPA